MQNLPYGPVPLLGGDKGYEQARTILQKRFGNNHLVADHIINHLLSKSPIKTAKEVQQLADDLKSGQETLSKIGKLQELDSQKSIIEIIQRLQPYLQTRWKKLALKVKKNENLYPSFSEFVDFMSQVASEMNDPVYGQMIPRRLHESSPRDKPRSRGNSATNFNSVAGAKQTPNPPSSGVSLHHPRRPEPLMCNVWTKSSFLVL